MAHPELAVPPSVPAAPSAAANPAGSLSDAAAASAAAVLAALHSSPEGLTSAQARRRAEIGGRNEIPHVSTGPMRVLASQLANPLLGLLAATAVISPVLHQSTDRSRPRLPLAASTLAVTAIGLALTFSPIAPAFGFARLGPQFVPVLAAIVIGYTLLVEATKTRFYRRMSP